MNKESVGKSDKSGNNHKTARAHGKDPMATAEALLPTGSWQRLTVGVAAAAGGGLLAVSMLGAGPVAIAGAAGYLAYRGLTGQKKDDEIDTRNKH